MRSVHHMLVGTCYFFLMQFWMKNHFEKPSKAFVYGESGLVD